MPILGTFQDFGGFLGPWGLPGPGREGWFYINPSRRGPVPGPGGVSGHPAPRRGGEVPEGGRGGLPRAEA